jgi:hypothetical protein
MFDQFSKREIDALVKFGWQSAEIADTGFPKHDTEQFPPAMIEVLRIAFARLGDELDELRIEVQRLTQLLDFRAGASAGSRSRSRRNRPASSRRRRP